jgi:hypothetical protein
MRADRQTDRHRYDEAIVAFHNFANPPKMVQGYAHFFCLQFVHTSLTMQTSRFESSRANPNVCLCSILKLVSLSLLDSKEFDSVSIYRLLRCFIHNASARTL